MVYCIYYKSNSIVLISLIYIPEAHTHPRLELGKNYFVDTISNVLNDLPFSYISH